MRAPFLAALALAGAVLAGCATQPAVQAPERFAGKLYVVLLDDKDHPSIRAGRSTWGLERSLTYRTSVGGAATITVPPGFVTDLASIPAVASPFLPPDGPWTKAAIVHDFLYDTHGSCVWAGHPSGCSRAAPYTRAEADDILREAMADRGISDWRAWAIHTGVCLGGAKGWGS